MHPTTNPANRNILTTQSTYRYSCLALFMLCLLYGSESFSQQGNEIWFNSKGQLISYPPEKLKTSDKVTAKISLETDFLTARTTAVFNSWVKVIETLNKPLSRDPGVTFGDGLFKDVAAEMKFKLKAFLTANNIPADIKKFLQAKIELLAITEKAPVAGKHFTPSLESLIEPMYEIDYFFYDEQGRRINSNGETYCEGEQTVRTFSMCKEADEGCGAKAEFSAGAMVSDAVTIPPNCYETRYQLRIKNNSVQAMMNWAANPKVVFPDTYAADIATNITASFGGNFLEQLAGYKKQLEILKKDPGAKGIDPKAIAASLKKFRDAMIAITDRLSNPAATNGYKDWVAHWLWITEGVPQMNPFDIGSGVFQDTKSDTKLSKEEKALYQVFETMVSKGAFKIEDLIQFDTAFKNIPRIKAAIDKETAAQTNEPMLQDRLLYAGILKSSTDGSSFMRHLDGMTNYIIMTGRPKKEITEEERLYVLVENKSVALKLSIAFETTSIATDLSFLTNETLYSSPADNGIAPGKLVKKGMPDIDNLLRVLDTIYKVVVKLRALPTPLVLPIYFEKDQTPDLVTDLLQHDFLFDPPASATYSVKQINADNSEKEVAKGSYRINKLYHFRFKAGLVYSFLKKSDYTLVPPGNFTLDNPQMGIDGTFGIQYYIHKQDIRNPEAKARTFFFVGLSMRNIKENFYTGIGMEPVPGLAISFNAHFGKREALTGDNGFPTGIRSAWGVNFAPSILVDGALFNRLFTFGNTNKTLIGL